MKRYERNDHRMSDRSTRLKIIAERRTRERERENFLIIGLSRSKRGNKLEIRYIRYIYISSYVDNLCAARLIKRDLQDRERRDFGSSISAR